jgi:hypothetical protein
LAGEILRPISILSLVELPSLAISDDMMTVFSKSASEKSVSLWHESGFSKNVRVEKMLSKTSREVSDRVDSATIAKIFLWTAKAGNSGRGENFDEWSTKNSPPSVYGEAAILPDLLKYPVESKKLSVYGGNSRHLTSLRVVRDIRAIRKMLTVYCRITQSGTKETSTTITNTEDRYAQSLV